MTVLDADGGVTFYSTEARTEPIWAEKQTDAFAFSGTSGTVVFSCRYRTGDTGEYWPVECTVPFEECGEQQATAVDGDGNTFVLLTYSIAEKVVTYRDLDGTIRKRPDAVLYPDQHTLTTGWYFGLGNSVSSERLVISGDVNLILPDGFGQVIQGGIRLPAGSRLTIWG